VHEVTKEVGRGRARRRVTAASLRPKCCPPSLFEDRAHARGHQGRSSSGALHLDCLARGRELNCGKGGRTFQRLEASIAQAELNRGEHARFVFADRAGKLDKLSSPFGGDSAMRESDLDAAAAKVDHRDQRVDGVEAVWAVASHASRRSRASCLGSL